MARRWLMVSMSRFTVRYSLTLYLFLSLPHQTIPILKPYLGSAPDISGKGVVNPVAAILSMAMLLQYSLCLPAEAKCIEEAVRRTIDAGIRTSDIGGTASTGAVGDAVAKELGKVLAGQK